LDYPGAKSEFERAIELDPNYATAHHWYAHNLVIAGRCDEALSEIQLAHRLDPYSMVINVWCGEILLLPGRHLERSNGCRDLRAVFCIPVMD
jgi:tetratricopeptide (TPR) repeat protein